MRYRSSLPGICIILGCLVWIYLIIPPSDDALLRQFREHPEINQLAAMFAQDQQPMIIDAHGEILLDPEAQNTLPQTRLDAYRELVKQSGAQRALGDIDGGVTLYYPPPLFLPGLTVKSLRYSPIPPSPLTQGRTDFYKFHPDQYQYVCRSIEASWYVCKDNED